MSREAPQAVFAAYKRINALLNAQDMTLAGPVIAAYAVQMGSYDSLSHTQQVRLANTMTGQHVARHIPQVADTALGRRMNEEVFAGEARIVPMHRMEDLWRDAHKDAAVIITNGQVFMEGLYGGEGREQLAFYLDKQARFLLHHPQALEAEAAYMEQISSEYGRRHKSDGFRMTQAALLRASLRPLLREALLADEEIIARFGERAEDVVIGMVDISLPWRKREITLTGFQVTP